MTHGDRPRSRPHSRSEGTGPVIDAAVVVPFTPPDEVQAFLETPAQIAAWFDATIDPEQPTLVVGDGAEAFTITAVENESVDHGRGQLLTGITEYGEIRGYLTLRTVLCTGDQGSGLGIGTEVWTHVELPGAVPPSAADLIRSTIRRAHRHLHDELGT
jgi:hypothetical protein